MELMDGDLRTLMLQRMQGDSARLAPFSISVACDIMLQVAEGVDHMHQRGFVHGNLKSNSILVKSSKDVDDEYISAKVSNFGLFKTKQDCRNWNRHYRDYNTFRWIAQELLLSQHGQDYLEFTERVLQSATFKGDAYSFAMLCIEILTGNMAFSTIRDVEEVRKKVLEGHRPNFPRHCPPDVKNLIELCWDPVPDTRPSFAKICEDLEHLNVVRLLCYARDRRSCSIVMELLDEDLHDLMRRKSWLEGSKTPTGPFSMDDAVHVILQIARGMKYVHGKNVVHMDLKSCNILVRNATQSSGLLGVKVADFGLSTRLDSSSSNFKASMVGTVRWMAPEVMGFESSGSSNYDPFKSDVYSFAMVCYEILTGRVPFWEIQNLSEVKGEVLVRNGRPSLPTWTPSNMRSLIEKCWHREARRHPSFSEINEELVAAYS